jgi:folate-dependent phosphoribosylglycinamide formyltransferase PurN
VAEVPMTGDESFESFAARMHAAEHRLLVDALVQFLDLSSKGAQP